MAHFLQEKRPSTLRARAAPRALLALSCRAITHTIGAVTVGAMQDLGHHNATRSCGVALSLILLSRGAEQHLWDTFHTGYQLGGHA